MKLRDKVAIVTGGGGGLGEGICSCLAREGAHLVVSDINLELAEKVASRIRDLGRKTFAVRTDVRQAAQCREMVDISLKEMARIDILVCAAGVGGVSVLAKTGEAPFLENIPEEEWDLTMDVNLKGVFLCNRAIAPYFKGQKSGKIINIASIGGRKGTAHIPHYSASKAGVIVLTQGVALQLAPFGINVNTVCPGLIWTPLWATMATMLSKSFPPFIGMEPEEVFRKRVELMIPMGKPQTAEGIGNAVVFLASREADEITGQALNVDGGAFFS